MLELLGETFSPSAVGGVEHNSIKRSWEPCCVTVFLFLISGKKVMVLNGGYRGNEGILESINEKRFSATIIIDSVSIKHFDLLCVERFSSVHWRPFTKKDGVINPVLQVGFMVCKMLWSHPAYSQPVGEQPHIPHCRLMLCCLPLKKCQDAEFSKF